mmetsp:Transcript_36376/g.92953  ORF Transcript_36376/g.92953 Transcript_36376/m.92953 type:complete len:212 (+) Transcript_36376:518-1153(+)
MPRASPPGAAPASSATLPRRGPCSTPSRTVRPSADACAAGACRASSSGLCTAGATGCSRWTRCGWRARCWPSWRGLPLRGSTSRAAAPRRAAPPGRSWRARRGRAWVRQGAAPASHRVLRPPGGTPRRATVIPSRLARPAACPWCAETAGPSFQRPSTPAAKHSSPGSGPDPPGRFSHVPAAPPPLPTGSGAASQQGLRMRVQETDCESGS